MTTTVSIDESGNLGSLDRYFIMSALIFKRTSDVAKAFKILDEMKKKRIRDSDNLQKEMKFSNSYPDERTTILKAISQCSVSIVFVSVDKLKSNKYRNFRNCNLYKSTVKEILELVARVLMSNEANLLLDENLCINNKELLEITSCFTNYSGKNAVKKVNSTFNKAVQLADFVSGSVREKYEHNNDCYYNLISEKVSIAHET